MSGIELWMLDFTGVDPLINGKVHDQGKTICIKTKSKGFFSLDLERFPSRQDLALKTHLHLAVTDENDETRDSFLLLSLCLAYEQGYGYGVNNEEKKCPYIEGSQNAWCWNYGMDCGTESRLALEAQNREVLLS